MNLSPTESAIGFYAYHQDDPGSSLYANFYSFVIEQLTKFGVKPTYIGPSGKDYPENYVKFGGRIHKKVVDSNFQGIDGLSIAATPHESDAPAYDSYFEGVISFGATSGFPGSEGGVVYSYFVINTTFLSFGSDCFEKVLYGLAGLHSWNYGLGFSDTVDKYPKYHLSELSHGNLTAEEKEASDIWYNTAPELRVLKLRSIYPYNILNEAQLSQEVANDTTLQDYIRQESLGTLEPLGNCRLYLWKIVDLQQLIQVRSHLIRQGLIIA